MKKVNQYLSIIIRNSLASSNGINPKDVKNSEIQRCLDTKKCGTCTIYISDVFKSTINGIQYNNVNCALIDSNGYHYYSNTFVI